MDTGKLADMVEVFEGIEDWRNAQQTRHRLSELLTGAVCAVLSGADDFTEISVWGRAKLTWLRGFLSLDYGVASPDTFERAFRTWVGAVIPPLGHEKVIAIDGKTSHRTSTKAAATPLHLVTAFAAQVGVVLGQTATEEKSNEITAIPQLLDTLDVKGCIVTIDAMGTQTAIARKIREGGALYVLCVKDNHPKLLDSTLLAHAGVKAPLVAVSTCETHSSGHGRKETRRCWTYEVGEQLHRIEQWRDLKSFVLMEHIRTVGDKTTVERHHYISSLAPDADWIAHAVRSHWEIEDRLHWSLDVQFGDDYARARAAHVAHNFALVRHIALNLFRLHTTSRKTSIKTKRLLASASDELRAEMLGFEPEEEDDERWMGSCSRPDHYTTTYSRQADVFRPDSRRYRLRMSSRLPQTDEHLTATARGQSRTSSRGLHRINQMADFPSPPTCHISRARITHHPFHPRSLDV